MTEDADAVAHDGEAGLTAVERNRRRYDALKRDGQTRAPRALPPPSQSPAPALPEDAVLHREIVPGDWYWATTLGRGEGLRLATPNGAAAVAIVAWALADPSERLNYADTIKIQWTAGLRKGRVLFSDMGRVMLSLIEDSCGAHDAIAGGSTPGSVARSGHNEPRRNTRDNFRLAAGKHGLTKGDVPPCISFFAPVATDGDGRLVWISERRKTGDFVDLRAEMDLLVAISNCAHPLDPDQAIPPAVEVTRHRLPAAAADDLCRTASAEAYRGFENADALRTMPGAFR